MHINSFVFKQQKDLLIYEKSSPFIEVTTNQINLECGGGDSWMLVYIGDSAE